MDLHPDDGAEHEMGYVFEELIRRFSEQSNETAGEHFTPREVIASWSTSCSRRTSEALRQPGIVRTLYDPGLRHGRHALGGGGVSAPS